MSEDFVGEIKAFAFDFAPQYWVLCDGTEYNISQYQALFAVIGYQYGGSSNTFKVPDLRGRTPIGVQAGNANYNTVNKTGGTETETLVTASMPAHQHNVQAVVRTTATQVSVAQDTPGPSVYLTNAFSTVANKGIIAYAPANTTTPTTSLHPKTLAPAGGALPHSNMSPYIAVNYCICVDGTFPFKP